MKHVDMRKLPAAAQEERRRQVIGLRQAGMTYDAIAAQVGLTPTGVFESYAGNWVTASGSGGGLCWRLLDLDAVAEPDTLDDLRQLVLAFQAAPCLGSRHDELEDHQPGSVLLQLNDTHPHKC